MSHFGDDSRPRTFEWARQKVAEDVRSRLGDYVGEVDSWPVAMRDQLADQAAEAAETRVLNAILNYLGSRRKERKLMSLLRKGDDTAGFFAQHNVDVEGVVRAELARFRSDCQEKFGL